jgi:hypothetical protein
VWVCVCVCVHVGGAVGLGRGSGSGGEAIARGCYRPLLSCGGFGVLGGSIIIQREPGLDAMPLSLHLCVCVCVCVCFVYHMGMPRFGRFDRSNRPVDRRIPAAGL